MLAAGQPAAASLLPAAPAGHGQVGRAAPRRQASDHIGILSCAYIYRATEKSCSACFKRALNLQ